MSMDGQSTKWRRNTAGNFNRLSRVHRHYRQMDGFTTTYSECERLLKISLLPKAELLGPLYTVCSCKKYEIF